MKAFVKGRPTWITVDVAALRHNLKQVRRLVGKHVQILAVVKANAYGHDALICAPALVAAGADALGVATVDEAVELQRHGLTCPMVVFGLIQPEEAADVVRRSLEPTVVSEVQLKALDQAARRYRKKVKVHLKVDTGMGRIGIQPADVVDFLHVFHHYPNVQLKGVFTHFAHADGRDGQLLRRQMGLAQQAYATALAQGYQHVLLHAANSAAVIDSAFTHAQMVRPGLMLYGLYPARRFKSAVKLKPVMQWKSKIIQLKHVPTKTGLSYGHTFITKRASMIATLPVGYADGFSRRHSNQGQVLIRGQRCPVVGRVCMDMCLIDVSKVRGVKVGDEAVLVGTQNKAEITVDALAEQLGTISYEVTCAMGGRVPRIPIGVKA